METFETLLESSLSLHGHLCPGQVIGVRMAMTGCRHVAVNDPKGTKKLIVYVEVDRCATDAIQSVTGCKLGKRTLKYVDYGKMAATFLNTETGTAVRVLARDDARERAWAYASPNISKKEAQLQAYKVMPEEELFVVTPVRLTLAEEDLPGHPVSRVTCQGCGEGVNDRREVESGGRTLCRACAFGAYYQALPVEVDTGTLAKATAQK
jgi:formylmethanofuran dehydrogenase subunit E